MDEEAVGMNYEFNNKLFLAKRLLNYLHTHAERQRVVRWLRKLATCNKCMEEMRLRNDFMCLLVVHVQNRELMPPFDENPPPGPLLHSAHLLASAPSAAPGPAR